jgi:murein L,D-transpeptidase YcbB/YkuD
VVLGAAPLPAQPADETLRELIRVRLEAAEAGPATDDGRAAPEGTAAAGPLLARVDVSSFYERRAHRPTWVGPDGLRPEGRRALEALADAGRDGLSPADYHVPEIRRKLGRGAGGARSGSGLDARPGPGRTAGDGATASRLERLADVELLLTDGVLVYGSHLLAGRLDAATLHPNWRAERREGDLVTVLEAAVEDGDVADALAGLRPQQPGYRRLMEARESYRRVAAGGGWPTIGEGAALAPGDTSPRVPDLRARLAAEPASAAGPDAPAVSDAGADSAVYGPGLAEAVRAFQRRHGLDPDGVVGPRTRGALNTAAADRVRQIDVNLERWRWLPQELGERYVLVNAADFRLDAVADGETELTMRAVVGRPYRQTPVFSDRITYMVFSPYWHVPHSLAVSDQLPLQKRDPGYFRRLGFRLFRGWSADADEVDPDSIDWSGVTAGSFPFRLRQDPGPNNFLGDVKFMFPNPWNVYLHDTPARDLFGRQDRAFSSGCVRLEKARELALWLLEPDAGWPEARVDRAMEAGREETARLSRPVPVHLLYWTAFADDDGAMQLRPDVYDRDRPVAEALERDRPASGTEDGLSSVGGAQGRRFAATDGPSREPTREER